MAAALALAAPWAVAAQEPPPPSAAPPPAIAALEPKRLDFNVSLFEAYDLTTVSVADTGLPIDPRLQQDTSFSGATASLAYSQKSRDNSFGASVGTDLRYYSIVPSVLPMDYFGGANVSALLTRRLRFRASGGASYSPYYSFGMFLVPHDATEIATPRPEQSIAKIDTYTANAGSGLSLMLTRRSSIDGGYSFDYVSTSNAAYGFRSHAASGGYRYRTTRYSELRLGYGYRRSISGLDGSQPLFAAHDIDAGFGYRRPLSFSRHTVVGFNVGSTIFAQGPARSLYITGDA